MWFVVSFKLRRFNCVCSFVLEGKAATDSDQTILIPCRKCMVECYIIRIYRRNKDGAPLAGIVEDTRSGAERPFLNLAELWTILSCVPGFGDDDRITRQSGPDTEKERLR